jgi:hypothetical protein
MHYYFRSFKDFSVKSLEDTFLKSFIFWKVILKILTENHLFDGYGFR